MTYKIQIDNEIFEATPEQVIEIEARQLNAENELKARLELASKRAAAKAKLEALGLDAEDLKALGL